MNAAELGQLLDRVQADALAQIEKIGKEVAEHTQAVDRHMADVERLLEQLTTAVEENAVQIVDALERDAGEE